MRWWRSAAAGFLALLLAGVLAWAQESPEASRPARGTGEAGRPSSGVLTIQGIFQGRPVTVDFHHQAAALAVTSHSVGISHITSVVHVTTGQSPHITSFWVQRCGTTASQAVSAKADQLGRRRAVMLYNAGTENIFIGGYHATVTATSGFVLHTGTGFTTRLTLENFHGRLDCITAATDSILQVIEIWR